MTVPFERLMIVADDLTGALDTAAPFAAGGRTVALVADQAFLADAVGSGVDVVAVTTRSREISAGEAARRVALAQAALAPGMRLFKKIDSRLKGNLAAELSALAFEAAVVLPGIPEFGRIVRNGMIEGFGVETPISIGERLGGLSGRCRFPQTLTPEDMRKAVETIGRHELIVGALSLARALAGPPVVPQLGFPGGRIVIAIGSRDPITLVQVERLRQARSDSRFIAAPNGAVDGSAPIRPQDRVVLIQAVAGRATATGPEVAGALAESAARFAGDGDTLLLSGGATAEAFFDRQGLHSLRLAGEALPGLPVAECDGRFYITKSGGFGEPDTIVQVAMAVTGEEAGYRCGQ